MEFLNVKTIWSHLAFGGNSMQACFLSTRSTFMCELSPNNPETLSNPSYFNGASRTVVDCVPSLGIRLWLGPTLTTPLAALNAQPSWKRRRGFLVRQVSWVPSTARLLVGWDNQLIEKSKCLGLIYQLNSYLIILLWEIKSPLDGKSFIS